MKRITKELTVNIKTLNRFGSYHDTILIPELDAYISLAVIAEKSEVQEKNGYEIKPERTKGED